MQGSIGRVAWSVVLAAALLFTATAAPEEQRRGRQRSREGHLQAGHPAPDFSLDTYDRTQSFTLSSFRGTKPVVLVFGSYT